MFPNMFKIAGEQLPAIFHVGSRSLASHALSIFGDHQDVMACRATGFALRARRPYSGRNNGLGETLYRARSATLEPRQMHSVHRVFACLLPRMMMTYGNIYVATVALGANYSQIITAMREAEAYPGPSIIVAYCPCINHGIRTGMSHSIVEERDAVRAGYWPLVRYNPAAAEPLTVDCAAPDGKLIDYINNENRYADLRMISPNDADRLQPLLQKRLYSVFSNLAASVKLPRVLG